MFLAPRSRMTERCQTFICALALETSVEGCARVCYQLGLQISGDTVIRLFGYYCANLASKIFVSLEKSLVLMTLLLRKTNYIKSSGKQSKFTK